MAEGKWVNIPGKGRRWQQPSGELMMTKPGFGQGEFFQTRASQLLGGASNLLGSMGLGLPGGPQAAGPLGPRGVFGQPPLTGKEKINKAWGTIPGRLHSPQGGGFGYFLGNQPNYSDAQGNMYDAVSGRLLYGAKPRTDSGSGSISGGSFVGGSSAAERAYQSEASRVAQLTAQDPELQRYEAARLKAVAPGATPEQVQSAEDVGMQIWRQKYGGTPMGQPGGAVGRFNPLMDRTFGYQAGMSPQQMQEMQATAAPVLVAPGEIPYQQGDLGTRATLETGYDPAQYGLSPNLVEEMKKRLLQQAGK